MSAKYIRKGKPYMQAKEENPCIACAGSGRYDVKGSPKCSACNGTGQSFTR